jgi:hypothetical protein
MYTIQAIPTVYQGRQYRSRLEAKWAAFFDEIGWRYEYEPFDLGEWSPDFMLRSNDALREILVEVKPITQIDETVCARMERAANEHSWRGDLMLLGTTPNVGELVQPWNGPAIGWLAEFDDYEGQNSWYWAHAGTGLYKGKIDFSHEYGAYYGRITHCGYKQAEELPFSQIEAAWSRASNTVQWHKRAKA